HPDAGGRGVRPLRDPGRPARHLARPHPPRPGGRLAAPPSGCRRGEGDEGADQDALPDGHVHLPGDVHRRPRPRSHDPPELLPQQMSPETENGFGTGLRAQLQRKQAEPEPTEAPPEAEAELELEATEPEERFFEAVEERPFEDHLDVIVQAPPPELAEIRAELEAALRREQELRDALQHQIEAREHELEATRDLALREAEAEQAASRLRAREAELER